MYSILTRLEPAAAARSRCNFTKRGQGLAVVGTVGSGKSALISKLVTGQVDAAEPRPALINQALEALFIEDGRYQVVGPYYRQEDALQAVRSLQPKLLLLDAEAALSGTPTMIERALAERPGLKVLVLADKTDLRIVLDAVAAGALGVVLKTSLPATVASAVESVLSDRVPEQPTTADAQHWITASPVNRLSSREREVLVLLGRGWSNEAIGGALHISPHTVRTHIQNILEKLGMHSRLEAATFALEHASEIREAELGLAAAPGPWVADEAGSAPLVVPLSEREQVVLRYLPSMLSAGEIAAELYVSINTVKTHIKSIYRKLDTDRRWDAVRRARQLRLL